MKQTTKPVWQSDSGKLFDTEEEAIADELAFRLKPVITDPFVLETIRRERELLRDVLNDLHEAMTS